MKIGIQTWGSEGDIRPFTALAAALVRAGHDVTLVVTEIAERDYTRVAKKHGFTLRMVASPVLKSPSEMAALGALLLLLRHPSLQARFIFSRGLKPVLPEITAAAFELAAECDLVIGHFVLHPLRAAAELSGIPYVSVQLVHGMVPTKQHSPLGFSDRFPWLRPFAWAMANWASNQLVLRDTNSLRAKHALPPFRDALTGSWVSKDLNLICVSPTIVDRPNDWDASHVVCGYLDFPVEDAVEEIPDGLEKFLDRGPAPVFFGFGSLVPTQPVLLRQTVRLWQRAARLAQCRAVCQIPEELLPLVGSLTRDDCYFAGRVPHRLLFPRCAAIVHHGGSGTTQAALVSGRPSVVVAHVADQFLWGSELVRLGAAPTVLNRLTLRARPLAAAVKRAIDDPPYQSAAAAMGDRMRDEDGAAVAADAINRLIVSRPLGGHPLER
ncbi:MAG: glycosyltransferase [Chthoniobacterales bacterium]